MIVFNGIIFLTGIVQSNCSIFSPWLPSLSKPFLLCRNFFWWKLPNLTPSKIIINVMVQNVIGRNITRTGNVYHIMELKTFSSFSCTLTVIVLLFISGLLLE